MSRVKYAQDSAFEYSLLLFKINKTEMRTLAQKHMRDKKVL
jgi:hypothetical protein